MYYSPLSIDEQNILDNFKQNIMLSNSTSNSTFLNSSEYENDRAQILDYESGETRKEMSTTRKLCFIASIVGCVLTVIVFLLLPCESNCPTNVVITTNNWMINYEKKELKGIISTVSSMNDNQFPKNLVFIFRSDKIFPQVSKKKNKNGIMSLLGPSGDVGWHEEMTNEPRSIDCSLIDCDKNGSKDCLVLDDYGQLACISGSGTWIYYTSNNNSMKQTRSDLLDFPLVLPDIDGDQVNELMMTSNGQNNTTDLIILSGATGKTIGKEKQNCIYLHKLQIDNDYTVKFICMVKENTEQQMLKPLGELYLSMTNKTMVTKKLKPPVSKINQHKFYGMRPTTTVQRTITAVQDKELIIENKGSWPRDCSVTLQLVSDKKGIKKTLYEFSGSKMYAMVPIVLSLNMSQFNKKKDNSIHGFIVKFWHWNGTESNYNVEKNRFKRSDAEDMKIKRDLKSQRSNYTNQTLSTNSSVKTKIRYLKETILLIAFNSTDNLKITNTSQSNIVQFCQKTVTSKLSDKKGKVKEDVNSMCQPDLNYQENSLLTTDIDGDGSKELISYYSTFINENNGNNDVSDKWKLRTFIQLIKLESELPKLFAGEMELI
ncbi:unnamed protein product [Diamesa tonsa]